MNIKDQIFGNRKKEITESDLIDLHDKLMSEYGWIPLEEFKRLPIPTVFNLLDRIEKRHKREEKSMNKPKRGRI